MARKCQLGPVLSYGSEGTVHSGTWCSTVAAIKVLCNQYARRVEGEVKLVRSLNHANIIKYYDLEYDRGTAYLAMEFITGGNLYEFIQKKFTADSYWTSIDRILRDVAQGMVYLHDHRIVQGDLKSHNILLREDTQQAVICDFGIAKSLDNEPQEKKRANTTKGTIRWMAPELCAPPPEPSSYASDVWSYGCIILEVTSAREPWTEQIDDDSLLFRTLQRKENAPIFARICANQSGPSHLCQLLIHCCSWSKTDRPRMTEVLRRFISDDNEATESIDQYADAMSVDESISDLPAHRYKEELPTPNDPHPTSRHGGRLTGEMYTSRGTASGRPIYEGAKGGRYYLTANGTKVYLHK